MTNAQEVSEIRIRERAYDLWERAGKPENESLHFWNKAREQLVQESTPEPTLREMVQGYSYWDIRTFRSGFYGQFSYEIARIFEEFPELQHSHPQQSILWHYTSGSSLIRIIESGEFWATHLSCLNDGREFIHGIKLMQTVLSLRNKERYTDEEKKFHAFLDSELEKPPSTYSDLYVASLSEKKDDLSQWRAYGGKQGENGYSIGFDATFVKTNYGFAENPFLGKVFYNEARHREICRRLLDVAFKFAGFAITRTDPANYLDVHSKVVYRLLEEYAFKWFPLMKDKSFEDEAEWRIIYQANRWDTYKSDNLESPKPKFLARESMISRHIPQTYLRPDNKNVLLPIKTIVVGPSRYQSVSRESVKLQLATKGYCKENLGWTPSVEESKIPLQG